MRSDAKFRVIRRDHPDVRKIGWLINKMQYPGERLARITLQFSNGLTGEFLENEIDQIKPGGNG